MFDINNSIFCFSVVILFDFFFVCCRLFVDFFGFSFCSIVNRNVQYHSYFKSVLYLRIVFLYVVDRDVVYSADSEKCLLFQYNVLYDFRLFFGYSFFFVGFLCWRCGSCISYVFLIDRNHNFLSGL